MDVLIDFNKKIIRRILIDLQNFNQLNLSCFALEERVHLHMGALDSTIPSHIKVIFEMILSNIEDHRQEQYAETLNTDQEGTYDQTLPVNGLLDIEIVLLEKYLSSGAI